jgi:hypothetical protein
MSNFPTSLNALVDGHLVCEILGSRPASQAWPTTADCPICKQWPMEIYRTDDGGWFHCRRCDRRGDMIDLVAAARGLSLHAAIVWLALRSPRDLPSRWEIDRHLETHVALRARTIALRDRAAAHLLDRSWWNNSLLGRCWFPPEVPWERLLAGPGGVLGIADAADVERCFSPTTMREEDRLRHRNNPSAHAVFRGRGWRDVLVFPYYDLPGRISGFQLVGRDGGPQDRIFKGVARDYRGNQHVPGVMEAGLAMHPGVPNAWIRGNGNVVAIDDVVQATRLQLRHFERSRIPLPLVVWHDSIDDLSTRPNSMRVRTHRGWDMLSRFEVAHWMPKFRFATVLQAMRSSGRVATFGPDDDSDVSLRTFLDRMAPDEFIRRVLRESRPLWDVLGEHLSRLSDAEVEQLYRRFDAEGRDPELVFASCAKSGGPRLAAALAKIHPRTADFDGGTLIERDGAWFLKPWRRPEQLLCDAIVRFDKRTFVKRTREVFLSGRILRASGDIPFSGVPESDLEKHGDRWLQATVQNHGGGEIQCHRRLARNLVRMANCFQRAKREPSFERLGWDAEAHSQYVLPGVLISVLGPATPLKNMPYLGTAPRRALEPPRRLQPTDFAAVLEYSSSNGLFWAAAASLIANVLAPQWHLDPLGVALVGAGAQTVGREVAAAMGCATVSVRTPRDFSACWEEEAAHDWPLFVERTGRLGFGHRMNFWRGATGGARKIVTAVDWRESRALLMQDGWVVVEGQDDEQLSDAQRAFATWLMPAYLQDLFDVRYRTVGRKKGRSRLSYSADRPWVDMVLEDLREFVERLAARRAPVLRRAQQHLVGPGFESGLADLLRQGLDMGQLRVVDEPSSWNPRRLEVLRQGHDQWLLSNETLNALVRRTRGPDPNLAACRAQRSPRNWRFEHVDKGLVFSPQWLFARQNAAWLAKWDVAAA